MTERATRKVLMSPELMEQWATRDEFGNRLRWDWRQPDGEWWEPTISVDYADNLVAAERARIAEAVRGIPMGPGRFSTTGDTSEFVGNVWAYRAAVLAAIDEAMLKP